MRAPVIQISPVEHWIWCGVEQARGGEREQEAEEGRAPSPRAAPDALPQDHQPDSPAQTNTSQSDEAADGASRAPMAGTPARAASPQAAYEGAGPASALSWRRCRLEQGHARLVALAADASHRPADAHLDAHAAAPADAAARSVSAAHHRTAAADVDADHGVMAPPRAGAAASDARRAADGLAGADGLVAGGHGLVFHKARASQFLSWDAFLAEHAGALRARIVVLKHPLPHRIARAMLAAGAEAVIMPDSGGTGGAGGAEEGGGCWQDERRRVMRCLFAQLNRGYSAALAVAEANAASGALQLVCLL